MPDTTTQLIQNVAPHSVELSTNAKGKVQVAVKVYDVDPMQAAVRAAEVLATLVSTLGDKAASG